MCSVQNQTPGSPIRTVFIMRLCVGKYVINRLSEKFAGSFVLPEDGGICFPEKTRNGLRKLHVVVFDTTASLHVHHRETLKSHISLFVSRLLGHVIPFLCPRSPFRISCLLFHPVATVGYLTASMAALSHILCNA